MTAPGLREALRPFSVDDEDWQAGERLRCAACGGHMRIGVRVATLDLGQEIYLCRHCVTLAMANLLEEPLP
jgi:hypothetical protein